MSGKRLSVIGVLAGAILLFSGCEGLRYAATEAQKENAWLHREVCAAAAQAARDENASKGLCELTNLSHRQSGAFVLDYGLPESLSLANINPSGLTATSPLQGRSFDILSQAKQDSARRPDVFELADGAMELGIALVGLVGGVYGLRIAGYLKAAREKSAALREIVRGNELFKQLYPEQAERFKEAQNRQSTATRQLVTGLKTG